jgi:hypothetical protein
MNNYKFLKEIKQDKFLQFVQRGIIPIVIMDYITIYDTYLNELKSNKKSVCITYCADKFNVHENTIRNIIKFMNK